VVRGDLVRIRPGDQLVVDGPVLQGAVEVAESLLAGESAAVLRTEGEDLLSGGRCVGGGGLQLARDVGMASRASRLVAEARRVSPDTTPLQRLISFCVRLVMVVVVLMSGAILLQAALEGTSLARLVQITAVLTGLVPYGLFLLIVLAYTAGAVASSRRGALVQQVNAVESMSSVDVICTEKTGTLTTGRLVLATITPMGGETVDAVEGAIASMVHSMAGGNAVSRALAAQLPRASVPVIEEVSVGAEVGWSAMRTETTTWVLGAPAALAGGPHSAVLTASVRTGTGTEQGVRVFVFARASDPAKALRGPDGRPVLPALEPLALLALHDELRPDVSEVLAQLRHEGIALKILSGDEVEVIAATATRAGLPDTEPVDAGQLQLLDDRELDGAVAQGVVFGCVAPEQKERIVTSLRRQGCRVAMVGDGVDDAKAMKAAHVGVAMRSGSAVTRDVADIVLTQDSLAALLYTRGEGRRVTSGIALSAQIFLTRVATQAVIIVTVTMLGLGFPYSPAQTGLTLFTVGLPTLFLTAWARPTAPDPHLLGTLARFVLPAAVLTAGFAVAVYTFLFTTIRQGFDDPAIRDRLAAEFEQYTDLAYGVDAGFVQAAATIGAQTGLSTFVSLASILLILFLEPPHRLFAAWTRPSPDRRPAVLVVALLAGLIAALVVPDLRNYFDLTRPAGIVYQIALPALLLWFLALAGAYRYQVLDRILGLKELLKDSTS
jgi:cation-transporting ATPase E